MRAPLIILAVLALTACGGGGGSATSSTAASTPAVHDVGPVVFVGDSITYHWDDPAWTAEPDLISTHIPGAIDQGVSGNDTGQMVQRFAADVLAYHPSVVVILGGTNDLQGATLYASADIANILTMVQEAEAAGAVVIVGTLPPNGYKPEPEHQVIYGLWNGYIETGATQYGYQVADFYEAMILPDGSQNKALFASDEKHPNSVGYAVMWGVIAPKLRDAGVVIH